MEKSLTMKSVRMSLIVGFLTGGLLGHENSKRKFQVYSEGKSYGNARNALRRRNDYLGLMFIKNGVIGSIRATALIGSIVFGTLHLTVIRDRFSLLYFPLLTATACSLLSARFGASVLIKAFKLGLFPGLLLSALTGTYAFANGVGIDDSYRLFKKEYEEIIHDEEKNKENLNV